MNPLSSALAASAACGDSMGSDTFYNEQALLWEVVRFVWAVSHVWTAPPVRAEVYAGSTRPRLCAAIWRRSFLWGVVHSIGRRLPWGVVRLVQAVTCVRTAPRPPYWRGAAWVQAQPAARKRVQAQPAAFKRTCRIRGGLNPLLCAAIWRRRFLWEVGTFYNERRILWGVVRFVWGVSHIWRTPRRRREEGAGSACRASPLLCRA